MPGRFASRTKVRRQEHNRARMVLSLYGMGFTVAEIGQRLNLRQGNVRRILRHAGIIVSETD